jgi:hypothetical protein
MAYSPTNQLPAERIVWKEEVGFVTDELVVAMPYSQLVIEQLNAWNADSSLVDADSRLRMGLVRLDAQQAKDYLSTHENADEESLYRKADEAARAEDQHLIGDQQPYDLDIVVRCLRRAFAAKYQGWSPTFGKNRVVQRLKGSYVIDGGGGDGGMTKLDPYVIDGGGKYELIPTKFPPVARRGAAPGSSARIGIIDTRLFHHPWLANAYAARSSDLLPEIPTDSQARIHHATFVTGMVMRQAPGAMVELRAALDDAAASSDTWTMARAIAGLATSEIDVLNLSFGCVTEDGRPPLVLSAALEVLADETVVVAAAGNHADNGQARPAWPAALDGVVAVGAVDGKDQPTDYSPDVPWVDAFAGGDDVVSTCNPGEGDQLFGRWSGTSFAAAAVTGAIAAGMDVHGTARASWEHIRDHSAARYNGRPIVALTVPETWPA